MEQFLRKLYKSERGNAMILVILLVLCMMLIGGAVMAVSFSHHEVSQAYKRTSNLYYLAESGAEKLVDNINKIVLSDMIELMKEASEKAKDDALGITDVSNTDAYKNLIYNQEADGSKPHEGIYHLVDNHGISPEEDKLYEYYFKKAVFEKIQAEIDGVTAAIDFEYDIKDEKNKANVKVKLVTISDTPPYEFRVNSTATLYHPTGDLLSEIKLEGTVSLSELIDHEEILLEEYKWKEFVPNTFKTPILTFGDLVVTNGSTVKIKDGSIRVKGYTPPSKGEKGMTAYPELEEYGGVYVTHGGELEVNGDVVTLSNLHTIKKSSETATNKITVNGDVIADSISIEDDYPYRHLDGGIPKENNINLTDRVTGQNIDISGDAYIDNDIAIDRYVKDSTINIGGSVYGITDKDIDTGDNPNKSSGIYATGSDSKIEIGQHAFIHGNAWISFDNGENFHALYESIGEPFEQVGDLAGYTPGIGNASGDATYLDTRSILINPRKVIIDIANYFYAPYRVSVTDKGSSNEKMYEGNPAGITAFTVDPAIDGIINNHSQFNEQNEVLSLFYKGDFASNSITKDNLKAISSLKGSGKAWESNIPDNDTQTIADIIYDASGYLDRGNPFNRQYINSGIYSSAKYYRGIQGYMFLKRDIFYKDINIDVSGNVEINNMDFKGDIIYDVVSDKIALLNEDGTDKAWEKDTPVYICNTAENENKKIDIKEFYDNNNPVKTIIIDKGKGKITLYSSEASKKEFYGMIISNGGVVFDGSGGNPVKKFTGMIISKGRIPIDPVDNKPKKIYTENLAMGDYAGILIKNDLEIYHDPDVLFDIRCKERHIKRAILDYLGLTNYKTKTDIRDILGVPSIDIENIQKLVISPDSVIDVTDTQIYKGIRFELKTLKKID